MTIVIISCEGDRSTEMVQSWLQSMGVTALVLYTEYFDFLEQDKISKILNVVKGHGPLRIWYRTNAFNKIASDVPADIRNYLRTEFLSSVPHILHRRADKILGSPDLYSGFSKIETLGIANECGLKTPGYIVTNCKKDIHDFSKIHPKLIVKPFSEIFAVRKCNETFKTLTHCLTDKEIEEMPDYFGITWVQERVPNVFDVRVCYFNGTCYAALIIKQEPYEADIVDYRDYANSNTQLSKVALSRDLEAMVKALMDRLHYNFGVLDFILTPGNEYVFLEVNKYGVFNDVSKLYGFAIEYNIASWLAN